MSITTLDSAIAGMQRPQRLSKALSGTLVIARPHSLFYTAGVPGAGTAPSSGLAGGTHTAPLNGCFTFVDGAASRYLARLQALSSAQAGTLMLCDRLWTNSGFTITSTSAQTVNSVTFPARDDTATTNGLGVYIGVEVSGTTGAGTPTLTVSYTNSDGTAGRTGTNLQATVASSIAGTFHEIGLQAGDRGVRSVQSLTLSATWTSGTIHLVAYRPIITLELPAVGIPNAIDVITSGMPELWAGSCLWPVFIPSATSSTGISGQFIQTNG